MYIYTRESQPGTHPFINSPQAEPKLIKCSGCRWPSGGYAMTYLDRQNSGWFSGSLWPFFNRGISNGWYTSEQYLNTVMGGWESGRGNYTAVSWGAVGF
jgi:hypothetical protein